MRTDRLETALWRANAWVRGKRRLLFTLALLLIYFLYMLYPLNTYLGFSLINSVGLYAFAVLGAFYLYFRGARGGWALRFVLLLVLWTPLSRILCGDRALTQEGYQFNVNLLVLCFTGLGLLLTAEERRRVLTPVAAATALFFTALGLMGLYASFSRRTLNYALTQSVTQRDSGDLRLTILGYNPNIAAVWFLFSSAALLYLLLHTKNRLLRILCAAALPIHALTIAVTYCRSCFLAYAIGAGLFAVLLGLRLLRLRGAGRAAVLVLLFAVTASLSYKGLELAFIGINAAGRERAEEQFVETEEEQELWDDPGVRGLDSTGRTDIWRTMPENLRREPARLLRGCLYPARMTVANEILQAQGVVQIKQSWHNAYLEMLNYMGLPGFLCMLGFSAAVLLACLRLLFSPGHSLATQTLALPVIGVFCYTQFESLLFFNMDFRSAAFFLLAGFVLAEAREVRA